MFGFIRDHRHEFRVTTMCRVLEVSRSGFYAWIRRPESRRTRDDRRLLTQIRAVHLRTRQSYGSPRIYDELRDEGGCGRHRIARIMRENGVVARQSKKYRVTTNSNHRLPVAPNLLKRCFNVDEPNRVWVR